MESHNNPDDRLRFTYALFKRILYSRALAQLCYAIVGTGSLGKQAEMEEDARCKLWMGGCGLMGKCFLLQVRRTLATLILHDDDSPEATSAIEAHWYRV